MNKTLSIGLAGFSFVIEEHAYIKLSDYLAALRNSLEAAEADEVMHDIEIRMVEIFKDALGKRDVINDADVEKMILQIGRPEQIEEQEEAYYSGKTASATSNSRSFRNGQKQLFRDPSRAKIAGVCAGLAHYTGLDIRLIRGILLGVIILDVFFTFAISTSFLVLLYIILWIVLPKARTASDFLKMEGKPANFDNLKEQSNKIVSFANESTQRVGEIYNENKPYIKKTGDGIWKIFSYILGAFFALMGISLLIGSFAMFGAFDGSNVNFFDNIGFYLQENNLGSFLIALTFLTIFIPALLFLFIAIKLFSPSTKFNNAGYVFGALVLLWLGLAAFAGFSAVKYKTQFSGQNEETENIAINTISDTLYVELKKVNIPANFKSYWDDVYSDGKTIYKQDWISVDVKRENVAAPYLVLNKKADGYNLPLNMKVPVEIADNRILIPNYFNYTYNHRFRDYKVDYDLVVPKTMKVLQTKDEWRLSINDENGNSAAQNAPRNQGPKSIVINSSDRDSVIVNGQKVPIKSAEDMLDSMNLDFDNLKDVNISIKNGKKEISIKTK